MPGASWYEDPTGRHELRYFDGQHWTDAVADQGQQSVDPVSAPPEPQITPQTDQAPSVAPVASPSLSSSNVPPYFKLRSPTTVILLSIVTLGIYSLFWYYYVNRELAEIGRVEGDPEYGTDPGNSIIAATWGSLVIVPAMISFLNTGKRVNYGLAESEKNFRVPAAAIVGVIALSYLANLFVPLFDAEGALTVILVLSVMAVVSGFYYLYSVQSALNQIHKRWPQPAAGPNVRMTGAQKVWLVLYVLAPVVLFVLLFVLLAAVFEATDSAAALTIIAR